ncbi:MAG: selenide, water dikinase SelD [Granulosicoccus sp.]
MSNAPVVRDICLVGGGHSHALLLRRWAMQPMAGVRLTLVSSAVLTPYSGMLPGLVAGHYSHDDIHIDLLRLCSWANVRFIEDTVTGIDSAQQQVLFNDRPALGFDVLSLDTGSTPDLSVPGSGHYVTPVKPVSNFHARWQQLQARLNTTGDTDVSIGVVGSGAGGFELVTAMQHQLRQTSARCYWVLRSDDAISGRPANVGKFAQRAAIAAGIEVIRHFDVVAVEPGRLTAADGRTCELDEIVWCTSATGPSWPAAAGLDVDARGFVATNAFLQSTSHPFVFATGDVGTQVKTPSRKAGVFAVRQAPVLFKNLRSYLLGTALKPYKPQKDFLSLMATGPRHAIASRGPVVVQGNWVWRWKNHIDQSFMDRFHNLPKREMNATLARLPKALNESDSTNMMRCRGCGAKVGSEILQRVLTGLIQKDTADDILSQWSPAGDTAVVDLPSQRLVQSVDQINAIVDDPFLLGRIAALHALSDVVTLNATLHSAQVLLTLPEANETVTERDLKLMMSGILSALSEESCALIGGHTTQGPDMAIGLAINATMDNASEATTAGREFVRVHEGDALILTKALGIGTLFAGLMQGSARGPDIAAAITSMLQSNSLAADILRHHGSLAMTDVTGFGLIGHSSRLLAGVRMQASKAKVTSDVPGVDIFLSDIPFLDGACELSRQGCRSSLWEQNSIAYANACIEEDCDPAALALLADPQTSGGLLAIVPGTSQTACLDALAQAGMTDAAVIGHVSAAGPLRIKNRKFS